MSLTKFIMIREYIPFGTDHLLVIGLIFCLSLVLNLLHFKLQHKSLRIIQIILGMLLLATVVLTNYYYISINQFDFAKHLPFHLCTISAYLAILVSFFPRRQIFWLLYFWGLIAAFVTLLAPDMGRTDGFGSFRHFEMMASHGLIFTIIFFNLGFYFKTLKLKYFVYTITILIIFTIIVGTVINPLIQGNYLYMASRPNGGQMNFIPGDKSTYPFMLAILVISILTLQYLVTATILKLSHKFSLIKPGQ
jgi:hypothetical integral membrane protein (TIGR02206 family)